MRKKGIRKKGSVAGEPMARAGVPLDMIREGDRPAPEGPYWPCQGCCPYLKSSGK